MKDETKVTHASKGHLGKGHGQSQGHGNHDHDRRRGRVRQQQQKTVKVKRSLAVTADNAEPEVTPPPREENASTAADNHGQTEAPEPEEEVVVKQEPETEENHGRSLDAQDGAAEEEQKGRESRGGDAKSLSPIPATPPPPRKLTQENYDVRSFNSNLDEFVDVLNDRRYQEMGGEYPVEDLMSVVSMVSAVIEEYKDHTQHTQNQLHVLRDVMKNMKENLHLSITREAFDLTAVFVSHVLSR
ncbi:hypothetical protein ACOMHN_023134 [Nucella lapillus]